MADVGLDADLVLDIRSALEQTRRIERALDAATTGVSVLITADTRGIAGDVTTAVDSADTTVIVTGEAASLTGDVTAAVDNADTSVVVTGDASELTGDVTASVDAGDSNVIVTGDASELTGAVTSAVDAADTNVVITADGGAISGLTGEVDGLTNTLGDAADSATSLGAGIATIGAAAALGSIGALVKAASDLEQAVGGTTAVFGEAEGSVVSFAEGAAEAAGLSEEAARRLTSGLGGLLQGFGFTQTEAAKTSVTLAQLGADLAATFGGNPEEAVQALGGALRGEFDPLERFGISLNVTQANLKAVELGLAESTGEVDLNARAQASLALIMERSALAQGQFGREMDTTAGQLERAKAEAINAAAAVGSTLQPAVVSLLQSVRGDLIPGLQDLGERLGPALIDLVIALLPAFGTLTSVLTALAPAFSALATVVSVIPAPLISLVGTMLAFRAAAGPLGPIVSGLGSVLGNLAVPTGAVAGAFDKSAQSSGRFSGAMSSVASAINPVNGLLFAGSLAFAAYADDQARAAENARAWAAQQTAIRSALQSTEGAVAGVTEQLSTMIEAGDAALVNLEGIFTGGIRVGVDLQSVFDETGLSARQFAEDLAAPQQPLNALEASLRRQGDTGAADAIESLTEQYETNARKALDARIVTEDWTEAQANAALEATKNTDGTFNYTAALDQLSTAQTEAAASAEAETAALTEQQQALQDLVAQAPAVGLLMTALSSAGGVTTSNLAGLAVAAEQAGLSTSDLQAVLAQLGGDGSLQSAEALQAVAETIAGVRDAAVGTLPSLEDIAGAADEFSLQGFRDELQVAYEAVVGFNDNLATIAAEGGPRLAAAAAQLGPEFAAGIAQGIRDGNPEVVAEAELLLAGLEGAGQGTIDLVNGTIGPGLATATGQMATAAAGAFGSGYVLDATGQLVAVEQQIQGGQPGVSFRAQELGTAGAAGFESTWTPDATGGIAAADAQIAAGATTVSGSAKTMGSLSKGGFEAAFTPNPEPAIAQARSLIEAGAPLSNKAGYVLAQAAISGYEAGAEGFAGAGVRAASRAIAGVSSLSGYARGEGFAVGSALGSGIEAGVSAWAGSIAQEARNTITGAVSAAKKAAGIASPSKVFAEIGSQMGQGLAVGLEAGATAVDRAAAALATSAAASADAALTPLIVSPVAPATVGPVGPGGGILGASGVTVNVAPGAVVINGPATPDTVRQAGQMLAASVAPDLQRQLKLTARTGGT